MFCLDLLEGSVQEMVGLLLNCDDSCSGGRSSTVGFVVYFLREAVVYVKVIKEGIVWEN